MRLASIATAFAMSFLGFAANATAETIIFDLGPGVLFAETASIPADEVVGVGSTGLTSSTDGIDINIEVTNDSVTFGTFNSAFGADSFALDPSTNNDALAEGFLELESAATAVTITFAGFAPTDIVSIEGLGIQGEFREVDVFEAGTVGILPPVATINQLVEADLDSGDAFDSLFTGLTGSTAYVFAITGVDGSASALANLSAFRLTIEEVPEPNAVALSLLALSSLGAVGMRTRLG